MLTLLPETRDNLVALKFSGKISEGDMDARMDELDDILQGRDHVRVMLDWNELQGWVQGAKSVGTWFAMHRWAHVDRVAVVADAQWEDEKQRIADVFKAATVQRFPGDKSAEALQWLTSD